MNSLPQSMQRVRQMAVATYETEFQIEADRHSDHFLMGFDACFRYIERRLEILEADLKGGQPVKVDILKQFILERL